MGVGASDPVEVGAPCCLGRLPGASIVSPGQRVRMCPEHLAALWSPTMPARHCKEWSLHGPPLPAEQFGGPQPTLESYVVFGISFCSVKYRDSVSETYFFSCWPSLVGKLFP